MTSDLPHRMPAPTRISTMPTAIALLNGNLRRRARAAWSARDPDLRDSRGRGGHLRRLRRVAVGLLERLLIGIGRVGIGAAVLHARLEPVEFRRGRRHVGIGLPRIAVGLRRGAAEIVGVGGDVAEAAHAGRLRRRRCAVVGSGRRALPGRSRFGGSAGSCIGICGCCGRGRRAADRRADCAADAASWPSGGRASRERAVTADADEVAVAECRAGPVAAARLPADGHWRGGWLRHRAQPAPPLGREASRARWAASDSTLRTASSSDSRSRVISDSRKRRLHAAQLRDQRGAGPLIERTAALAGGTGVQAGNGACDQRVIISHSSSIIQSILKSGR